MNHTTTRDWDYHVDAVSAYGCPVCHSEVSFVGATQDRTDKDIVDFMECQSCSWSSTRTVYFVGDLQAVEPDELPEERGISVEIDAELDSMGFNRVAIFGPSRLAVEEYVRDNWGDEDAGWFAEYVVGRIEAIS